MNGFDENKLTALIRQEIRGLHAYQPESSDATIRLDANESPYDVPLEMKQALFQQWQELSWQRYPDPDCTRLKQVIAEYERVDDKQLLVGNGSDELIRDLMTVFIGSSHRVVFPTPTFSMYRQLTIAGGGMPVGVPLCDDWSLDLNSLIREIAHESTRLVFIAAPNNPTGMAYPVEAIEELVKATNGLVVIDEAYRLFADHDYHGLSEKYDNVIVMHTFSKAFSLAGCRIGYIIAHPSIVTEVNKVRLPYNVDSLGQLAAREALLHPVHWQQQAELVKQERRQLTQQLAALPDMTVYPSSANFILIRHPQAAQIKAALEEADILVRGFKKNLALQNCLRITIGQPQQNQRVDQVIASFLKRA